MLILQHILANQFANNVVRVADCDIELLSAHFKERGIVYYCEDTGHTILHSLQLIGLVEEEAFHGKTLVISPHGWIEIAARSHEIEDETSIIPYTGCFTLEDGTSGSLQATVAHSYGFGTSLDFGLSFLNALVVKLSQNGRGTLGGSLSMTAEYICSGKPGGTVQLQLARKHHVFRNSKWRAISTKPHVKFTGISHGVWRNIGMVKSLVSSPIIKCVTDPSLLKCGSRFF